MALSSLVLLPDDIPPLQDELAHDECDDDLPPGASWSFIKWGGEWGKKGVGENGSGEKGSVTFPVASPVKPPVEHVYMKGMIHQHTTYVIFIF